VYQISATSSTTTYPYKFYSVASTTNGSTNFATSTEYAFNGDTLLETVDQAFKNGAATGTPQTRYVHPDHLGSTDVVTDQNQNVVQTLDYYPYGATRISVATSTRERRQFIGQFTDDSSLSYLNARYMDPSRGQFLSQEQIYLALGDRDRAQQLAERVQQAYLSDPQRLNMYSYGKDNPIGNKDTSGLISEGEIEAVYKLLYANSGRETVNSGIDAFFGSPGQTPQERASAQAQFRYDAGTFSVRRCKEASESIIAQ
jgi:RHS repeat-associated protein